MASREEILANFQACTGIEDLEVAILQLEEANWNLTDAVNKAIPSEPTPPPPTANTSSIATETQGPQIFNPFRSTENHRSSSPPITVDDSPTAPAPPPLRMGPSVSIADDFFAGPSSSSYQARTRMLEFNIQHNNRMIHLKVPDSEDVKTLKQLLQSETGYPPCQQELRGLKVNSVFPMTDRRKLNELNLPKENFLYLVTPNSGDDDDEVTNGETDKPSDPESEDYTLEIFDESTKKEYKLNFRPTKTVLDIKIDVSMLTNISVSKQIWKGWPEDVMDELSLVQTGIPKRHKLSLRPKDSSLDMPIVDLTQGASTSNSRPSGTIDIHSDSDNDFEDPQDMMDDDDNIFVSDKALSSKRIQPLIPDDYGSDDAMAAIRFAEEFSNRYGQPHPMFFPGSLDDAIRESCSQPAKDRKMLAVYLHHDSSVLTNVFCTQALCSDSVCSFLNENFVTFGWDLTFSSNKTRAVNMITKHFGSVAASTLKNMDIEKLPVLVLIYKLRGSMEIFQMLHGNVMLDELMSRLLAAYEQYQAQLSVEIREEEERAARDAVKREQDLAFEMSLMADREKEAAKEKEEAERLAKEAEERKQKEKADKIREARVRKLSARLPPEPKDEKAEGRPVSQLRFRIPATHTREEDGTVSNGETKSDTSKRDTLERRFLASDSLQTVLDYLTIEGFPHEEYKVLSSWPRRDLTSLDTSQTLKELKLYPQETLTLEEKH